MFVNKEVLKKAGVDVPTKDTTWDEFLQMCEKIKKAGYTPIAASLLEIPHYWFEYSIYNFDSPTTHNTVPAKVDDAAGKAWVSGLEDIKTLYEKGYFPANTLTAKDDDSQTTRQLSFAMAHGKSVVLKVLLRIRKTIQ